ncbi:uncharacterized protein H6S33_005269 [Morchella sextelata]|uniref:uncharacterized protein n=1 Tax=Morchella sextelata TaxID=1174677 RepID=UPI001D047C1D|nr:uncharacterized protein H6S33_005269 [Morchella sextelata]KAH0605287.1 hypothetical protein H6S33_005269 [Morchella sextelata]
MFRRRSGTFPHSYPVEIILAIVRYLPSRDDIASLSSVSHYLRAVLSPLAFRCKLTYQLCSLQLGPIIHGTQDSLHEWCICMCPPAIRPHVTDIVLSLNHPYRTRFPYDSSIHANSFEGIRSLSLLFIREHGDFRGTDRNLARRELFDRAMSWVGKSCRESLSPDSLTIDGIDLVHASLKLVAIEASQRQSCDDATARLRQFLETWVLPATSVEKLQILSEFYMRPNLRYTPRGGVHFKHLRELSLSKIMFSPTIGPDFIEELILSDDVSATLEKLTLTRCPICHSIFSGGERTWAFILTRFATRLKRLKMFRVEKKLGYKMLFGGHRFGFLHKHAERWIMSTNEVYLADAEALLQLWKKIGQTPRFTDQRRLMHFFD